MEIKTKFNVGDEVYVISTFYAEMTAKKHKIEKIKIKVDKFNNISIRYTIFGQEFDESCVFNTKEELKNYFFKD